MYRLLMLLVLFLLLDVEQELMCRLLLQLLLLRRVDEH